MGPKSERREFREEGASLIEVLVALVVLVAVLVPALFLVSNSTKVVYNNQFKVTAANLANGQLETARNQVIAQQTVALTAPTTPRTIGSESYKIVQQGGWCTTPTTTVTTWGNSTSVQPYAFVDLVTVSWNGNPTGIQVSGVLTTPTGVAPTGNPALPACPI
jgi:type II secretory pathway pseudopilin PulG